MKFFCLMAVLAVVMGVGVSCGNIGGDEGDNPYKKLNLTTKSEEYVKQGTGFAFEFIDRIQASEPGDFFISPLSMQFLLGMLLNGAQGETADEICQVLGYGKGEKEAVNQYCLEMLSQLPKLDKKTTLNIANAIFLKEDRPLKEEFSADMAQYYDAEVRNLDFYDPSSVEVINQWCSDHTNGMIPKILD